MTIITYRRGCMSADTIAQGVNVVLPISKTKIARDIEGNLYGVAGEYGDCCRIINEIHADVAKGHRTSLLPPKKGDDTSILVAYTDGRIRLYQEGMEEIFDNMPFFAIGSGQDFAYGAFHAGADAREAAQAAVRFCKTCGGEVDTLYFGEAFEPKKADHHGMDLRPGGISISASPGSVIRTYNPDEIEAAVDRAARES